MENSTNTDDLLLRQAVMQWRDAILAKNVDQVASFYTPDVEVFNVSTPTKYSGIQNTRTAFSEFLDMFDGPVTYDVEQPYFAGSGDVGFAYSLNHVQGKGKDGKAIDMWFRMTSGFRKIDGKWLRVHEHFSVPFNMENGKMEQNLV